MNFKTVCKKNHSNRSSKWWKNSDINNEKKFQILHWQENSFMFVQALHFIWKRFSRILKVFSEFSTNKFKVKGTSYNGLLSFPWNCQFIWMLKRSMQFSAQSDNQTNIPRRILETACSTLLVINVCTCSVERQLLMKVSQMET